MGLSRNADACIAAAITVLPVLIKSTNLLIVYFTGSEVHERAYMQIVRPHADRHPRQKRALLQTNVAFKEVA